VGGLAEAVVDGETGWLCARPEPAALAAALEAIVAAGRDECRRRGAGGERLARERWSWEAIAATTTEVYDRSSDRTSAE
jgi:glycosyltransferase involved in cell wall biosynthesis